MWRKIGPMFDGSGVNPSGPAGKTLVTLATEQTIPGDKTLSGENIHSGANTFSSTVGFSNVVTVSGASSKLKIVNHLVIPTTAPGTPEDGSFYWTT